MWTMPLVHRLARPLLGAAFIHAGLENLRHAKEKAHLAEQVTATLSNRFSFVPDDPVAVTRYDAAAKLAGGLALSVGVLPRLSAFALAVNLVPTTLAGHRFWAEHEPAKRTAQRIQFLKNAGLLGGLLLAATDTGGRPSLAWRARRVPGAVRHTAHDIRRDAPHALRTKVGAARDRLPV